MYFDSVGEFLAMGGHGVYVWAAYGSTALLIGANLVAMLRRRQRVRAGIRRALGRQQLSRTETETSEH